MNEKHETRKINKTTIKSGEAVETETGVDSDQNVFFLHIKMHAGIEVKEITF